MYFTGRLPHKGVLQHCLSAVLSPAECVGWNSCTAALPGSVPADALHPKFQRFKALSA